MGVSIAFPEIRTRKIFIQSGVAHSKANRLFFGKNEIMTDSGSQMHNLSEICNEYLANCLNYAVIAKSLILYKLQHLAFITYPNRA